MAARSCLRRLESRLRTADTTPGIVTAMATCAAMGAALVLSGCGPSPDRVTGPAVEAKAVAPAESGADRAFAAAAHGQRCSSMGKDHLYEGVHCAALVWTTLSDGTVQVFARGQSLCRTVEGANARACAGVLQDVGVRFKVLAGPDQGQAGWAAGSPHEATCGRFGGMPCPAGPFPGRSPSISVPPDADCVELSAALVKDFVVLPTLTTLGPGPDLTSLPRRFGRACPAPAASESVRP